MASKYAKREPDTFEAIQWRGYTEEKGGNYKEVLAFLDVDINNHNISDDSKEQEMLTANLEYRTHVVVTQDSWIVKPFEKSAHYASVWSDKEFRETFYLVANQ